MPLVRRDWGPTSGQSRRVLRILEITPWYGGSAGGVAVSSETLVGALARRGTEAVVVILQSPEDKWFERGRYGELLVSVTSYGHDVRDMGLKSRFGYYFRSMLTGIVLTYIVLRYRVKIAHFQYAVPGFAPMRAWLRFLAVPFVITFRGSDVHQVGVGTRSAEEIDTMVRESRAVTTTSAGLRLALAERSPASLKKTEIIPNAIPLDMWDLAAETNLDAQRDIDLLFVGNLRSVKGPDFLIAAFKRLIVERPSTSLVLVGSGDMEAQLRLAVSESGLDDEIRFAGRATRDDIADYYSRARLLVVPSRAEGFSLVAAEAQLFGVPVVATCVGGLPETVRDGQTGALVAWGDVSGFAEACRVLLDDDEVWARSSLQARAWALSRFSPDVMALRYMEFYDRCRQRLPPLSTNAIQGAGTPHVN